MLYPNSKASLQKLFKETWKYKTNLMWQKWIRSIAELNLLCDSYKIETVCKSENALYLTSDRLAFRAFQHVRQHMKDSGGDKLPIGVCLIKPTPTSAELEIENR